LIKFLVFFSHFFLINDIHPLLAFHLYYRIFRIPFETDFFKNFFVKSILILFKDITFVFHQKSHDGVNNRELSPPQQSQEENKNEIEEDENKLKEEKILKKEEENERDKEGKDKEIFENQKTPPKRLTAKKVLNKSGRKRSQEENNVSEYKNVNEEIIIL